MRAAIITVTNVADNGAGSLRAALASAANEDTITFSLPTPAAIKLTEGELLVSKNVRILGPGAGNLTVDGNASSRVFHIGSNAIVTIASLTIANGRAYSFSSPGSEGGGIFNDHAMLTISNCALSGNRAFDGGGVFNDGAIPGSASLRIINSTVSDNSGATGGGLFNNGSLQIVNSTLSGNGAAIGGCIFNRAVIGGSANVQIVNSTLSDNLANFVAGGIFNFGDGGSASVELGSTILNAGTVGANILNHFGTIISLGYNLSSDDTGGVLTNATDQINTDPMLGPLHDNGGPTFTHAYLCRSPAIDRGKNFGASNTDQRGVGFVRTFDDPAAPNSTDGDGTDAGAFEAETPIVDSTPPSITCPSNITVEFSSEAGAVVTYSVAAADTCDPDPLVVCAPPSGSMFPISATSVQCTARDAEGNSASCSFIVMVLGARGTKENVLAELITLRDAVTNPDEGRKLDEAIEHLTQSLTAELWVDQTHLERKPGEKVFHEDQETLKELCYLNRRKKSSIPDSVIQGFGDRIFQADRLLATFAIQDAISAGVSRKKTEQAQKYLTKGDENAGNDKCDVGIDDYGNAWKHAVRAIVSPSLLANGRLQLEILGEPGERFTLQASSNLVHWVTIITRTANAEGAATFEDADAVHYPARYYRAASR